VGHKIDTSKSTAHLKKQGPLSETEKAALVKYAHHAEEDKDSDEEKVQYKRISKANKTMVYIPEERMVKVPVVRKEKEKIVEKHTVQGTRLVPVTKYKEVAEVNLHDRPVRPGERAWSGNPKTTVIKTSEMAGRTRKIPYTDFIEEKFDITVDVPREVIKTRVGYRMDKQLHSHAVEITEDCEYEMRPLCSSGRVRRRRSRYQTAVHGKAVHGDPVWDGGLHDGWHPEFGAITPQNTRPGTAMNSRPGTSYSQRPGTGMGSPTGREELRPIKEFTSRPGTSSRPGTGTRSAPNLHAR